MKPTNSQLPSPLLSMLIEEFIDSLRWSNRSISTVNSYRHDLISFLNHQECKNEFTLLQFTPDALEDYFSKKSECVKPATLARYQSSFRSFCRWLIRKDYLQKNPFDTIEGVKVETTLPKANKQEELKRLFDVIKDRKDWIGKRDLALFLLLYQSGLRASEALSLKIGSIDFQLRTIKIMGKGQVEAIVPFSSQAARAIRAYLRTREESSKRQESPLFLSYRKRPLSYRQVYTRLKEYAQQAEVSDITPHTLRHSFCTHLLTSGRNLREIQLLARHKSIQSTQRYLDLSLEQTISAYRSSEEDLEI
ncbi:tyrosine-type recombinase/integrase [Candidatus Bathyarchaeota archaeon]|nr:tyrosine-type recombinase/integrase [Candidatus Bathyarchaeota archaeon]